MSRIGKLPVSTPNGVTCTVRSGFIKIGGPKGELTLGMPPDIQVSEDNGVFAVSVRSETKKTKALQGFFRATLANAVEGVSKGWTKTLELSGVGYRASISGNALVLTIGFSHPVTVTPPTGINFDVTEGKILISGIDRQLVGQIAANIRSVRPPEPYKGKGIKYSGEYIRKKAGKSAKTVGGAPAGVTK